MLITNFPELALNPLREKALQIAEAGYEAIEIEPIISKQVKIENDTLKISRLASGDKKSAIKINLNDFKRIFLIGIGKGSALASAALARILGKRLTAGIALDIAKPNFKFQILNFKFLVGTHPLPSAQNVKATQEIVKLVKNLTEKDLLITFICGGGSALTCASEQELKYSILAVKELTLAGADITELNAVRKHLSDFKGGGLAKIAYPAKLVSLIVSDVCGNDPSTISSGPTTLDKTTKADAENVLKKYGLNPADFPLLETPKDEIYFKNVENFLFVTNEDAVLDMVKKAETLGFHSKIFSLALNGEAKSSLLAMLQGIKSNEAFLAGGETTVTLKRNNKLGSKNHKIGKGGRNTEAVLGLIAHSSLLIAKDIVAMSLASDGHDNTEAAGAIGDYETLVKAKKFNLDIEEYLNTHSTFAFFEKTGDLVFTEPKSFNVADLMIVLKE